VRRVVALLLAIAVLGGVVAMVASGSDVASRKASRPPTVQVLTGRILAQLKSLKPSPPPPRLKGLKSAPGPPRNCSAAIGGCVEGCALPVAGEIVTPRPVTGLCRSTSSRPCFELIAGRPSTARASFCTPQRPGVPLFENLPRRLRRQR
jgi:hypothetical protein